MTEERLAHCGDDGLLIGWIVANFIENHNISTETFSDFLFVVRCAYHSFHAFKQLCCCHCFFCNWQSLGLVLIKDCLDIRQLRFVESGNPIGESNGIVDGRQGSSSSGGIQLEK